MRDGVNVKEGGHDDSFVIMSFVCTVQERALNLDNSVEYQLGTVLTPEYQVK